MRRLLLLHGRGQQHLDAQELKNAWLLALRKGLEKNALKLPFADEEVSFPYYGDTLIDLAKGVPPDHAAEVVTRGLEGEDFREFTLDLLEGIKEQAGITDDMVGEDEPQDVRARGFLNNERVRAILKAIDHNVPLCSTFAIKLFIHDVYHYLFDPVTSCFIDGAVRNTLLPGVPTVIVGHSLGSVVAYNILNYGEPLSKWEVPLLVTLGSPLAVKPIKKKLRPIKHPACVKRWFNAMDPKDIVALYPLSKEHFKVDPSIENWTEVDNNTDNHHEITGYLEDGEVARRIFDALDQT